MGLDGISTIVYETKNGTSGHFGFYKSLSSTNYTRKYTFTKDSQFVGLASQYRGSDIYSTYPLEIDFKCADRGSSSSGEGSLSSAIGLVIFVVIFIIVAAFIVRYYRKKNKKLKPVNKHSESDSGSDSDSGKDKKKKKDKK